MTDTRQNQEATGGASDGPASELIFDALSDVTRQWVLHRLSRQRRVSVDDLVTYIARQTDGFVDRERIAIALIHIHLPMLEDAAFLTYDHDTVQLRVDPDELAPYLDLTDARRTDI